MHGFLSAADFSLPASPALVFTEIDVISYTFLLTSPGFSPAYAERQGCQPVDSRRPTLMASDNQGEVDPTVALAEEGTV